MNYLGIDPGRAGAMVLLNQQMEILEAVAMPKDEMDVVQELARFALKYQPHVILEKAQSMPKQGVKSIFTYAQGYGVMIGAIISLKLPLTILRPREWQKLVIENPRKQKPKDVARITARNLWPEQSWLATQRCSVQHKGLIDAALISEAGRRLLR